MTRRPSPLFRQARRIGLPTRWARPVLAAVLSLATGVRADSISPPKNAPGARVLFWIPRCCGIQPKDPVLIPLACIRRPGAPIDAVDVAASLSLRTDDSRQVLLFARCTNEYWVRLLNAKFKLLAQFGYCGI